jgi:hypothetical protein
MSPEITNWEWNLGFRDRLIIRENLHHDPNIINGATIMLAILGMVVVTVMEMSKS